MRPRVARQSGKLRHYGRGELGACPRRSRRMPDASLPGSGWRCSPPLRSGRPSGPRFMQLGGFVAVAAATILFPLITVLLVAPLAPVPAAARRPSRAHEGAARRLASGMWFGIEHRWLWRDDCLQLAAVSRTWLEPALALLSARSPSLWSRPVFSSVTCPTWRRQGCAGLRAGARAHRLWLLRSFIRASVSKLCAALRRKAAGSRWVPTPSFSTWRLGLAAPRWACSRAGPGLGSVFLVSAIIVLCAAVIAAWLLRASSRRSAHTLQYDKEIIMKLITMALASLSLLASSVGAGGPDQIARRRARGRAGAGEYTRKTRCSAICGNAPASMPATAASSRSLH